MLTWLARISRLRTLKALILLAVLTLASIYFCTIKHSSEGAWLKIRIWPFSRPDQMKNGSTVRGIHQTMTIFAQNNNTYLPGLDQKSQPHTQPAATQPQPENSWKSPRPSTAVSAPDT